MHVKVLYHGHCFDGFSSAAVFTRFYLECVDASATITHQGLKHGTPDPVDVRMFDADVHAIVDFRYSPSPRLDWWFDHHRSAFVTPRERVHFEQAKNQQHFWDPEAPSCCGYMARILATNFGFNIQPLSGLIHWANLIDTASFENARAAVALKEPAFQLMSVLEHVPDGPLAQSVIEGLSRGALAEVAAMDAVQKRFAPIYAQQQATVDIVSRRGELHGDTFFVDLTGSGTVVYNKFVPYYLHPEVTYVVVVYETDDRVKISVGSNPWRPDQRRHNIADICEYYGGGGHPVVGGITDPSMSAERGLEIGREIVALLTN